jgi:hypothetical protein
MTGERVVPCCWRNSPDGGPMPLAGGTLCPASFPVVSRRPRRRVALFTEETCSGFSKRPRRHVLRRVAGWALGGEPPPLDRWTSGAATMVVGCRREIRRVPG